MTIEKNISHFQMLGNRILNVKIENSYFDLSSENIIHKSFDYNSIVGSITKSENSQEQLGTVELTVKVEIKGNSPADIPEQKYIFELTLEGCFSTPSSTSEDMFKDMLRVNGSAALFSIARSFIIGTSAQTCLSGQIILPMVNFTISRD